MRLEFNLRTFNHKGTERDHTKSCLPAATKCEHPEKGVSAKERE